MSGNNEALSVRRMWFKGLKAARLGAARRLEARTRHGALLHCWHARCSAQQRMDSGFLLDNEGAHVCSQAGVAWKRERFVELSCKRYFGLRMNLRDNLRTWLINPSGPLNNGDELLNRNKGRCSG